MDEFDKDYGSLFYAIQECIEKEKRADALLYFVENLISYADDAMSKYREVKAMESFSR